MEQVILKHQEKEAPEFEVTEDDIRFIPYMIRRYVPTIFNGSKNYGKKREWRVNRIYNGKPRELVLVLEEEHPKFSAQENGQQTMITFYVQNPRKMGASFREKHPLSEEILES